jgi:hypothetical protein
MTMLAIDAPYVPTRRDYRIERGALGIGYYVRGPVPAWLPSPMALDWERADAIIATILREEEHVRDHPGVMY